MQDPILDLGLHTRATALELLAKRRHYKVANRRTGKLTNRRECTFFVHADVKLPVEGTEDSYFPGMTSVAVPYKTAVRYIENVLEHFEERGARISIKASSRCIFIG